MPASFLLPPIVSRVLDLVAPGQEIYLVGGAVRDLLLSRISPDLDFAVPTDGIALARKIAKSLRADFMALDLERDTGRVIITQENGSRMFLDFAVFRGGPSTGSPYSLEDDLRARDFSINAMAYDLRNEAIIDPLEGGHDLRAKVIRACSPSAISDDPVRILRGVRLATALGFKIEQATRAQIKQAVAQLEGISPERLRDEVFKILKGPGPETAMRALEMLGVLPFLMPELTALKGVKQSEPHMYDVWTHTLAVLDYLDQVTSALRVGYDAEQTNDMFTGLLTLRLGRYRGQIAAHFAEPLNMDRSARSLLFFAALYHDVCKPETKTVEESGRIRFFDHEIKGAEVAAARARAFNLSNLETDRLRSIIRNHMRIHFFADRLEREKQVPSRRAIYRFFRDAGQAGPDLVLFALADARATRAHALSLETWTAYLDVARTLLENYWERPAEAVAPPRLLDGTEIMLELHLQAGPMVGRLLESIRENQAAGKIENREQALAFARDELSKGPGGEA